jgi:hypothetical protein
MLRDHFSPIRTFIASLAITSAIFLLLTMIPTLTVKPVATTDPGANFGMMFNLANHGIAMVRDLTSTLCVNSATKMGSTETANGGVENFGDASQTLVLSDLDRGDAVALPFENLKPGPPGSSLDLVFVIRFQPGWWFWHQERRFRFSGTEASDRSWTWKPVSPGGPCQ